MLVRNTTPFFHAAVATSRRPPKPEMVLVVRGTFALRPGGVVEPIGDIEQGFLSGDRFAEDDDARALGLLWASDFADFKLHAEVLLLGACHAPKSKPTTRSTVRFGVGAWKKDLVVHGDRIGGAAAQPFTTMPIDYAHAFGGPGFAANPAGRGHGDDARRPNVELPEHDGAVASYAPINPAWPQRARYLGKTFDADYRKTRAPFHAVDHDWRYFQAAPADQQLEGYLRGDETLLLQNLHPDHAVLETRLPSLRLRAFVKDETGVVRPVPMALDTLVCEPDANTVKLTWRGLVEVADEELDDVTHVYVASESLDAPPLPDAHYHAELAAFEADPSGALAELPEAMRLELDRLKKEQRGEAVPPRAVDPTLDPLSRKVQSSFGGMASEATLAATAAQWSAAAAGAPEQSAALAKQLADAPAGPPEPPAMRTIKPGRLPDPGLRQRMRELMDRVAEMKAAEQHTGKKTAGIEKLEAVPRDPKWKELDPEYEVPGPLSTDAPGPGADLRERDLSGLDLAGIDLSGANLERANLARANLRGANLAKANLRHALLHLTVLEGANLAGANLELANAFAVRAAGADFTGARLDEAYFEAAQLEGARLTRVQGAYAIFEEARLAKVDAEGAVFDHADLGKAVLTGASFRRASLEQALLAECKAMQVDFTEATLAKSSFVDADLREAKLVRAKARACFFHRAKLDAVDLAFADLREAHLTKVSAKKSRFYGANLRDARLDRSQLEGASFVAANLMGADLSKARVAGATLADSNLYEAKLRRLRGDDVDLSGAVLDRAVFE